MSDGDHAGTPGDFMDNEQATLVMCAAMYRGADASPMLRRLADLAATKVEELSALVCEQLDDLLTEAGEQAVEFAKQGDANS